MAASTSLHGGGRHLESIRWYRCDDPRLVADDHPLVREALTSLLGNEDDIEVLGAAADGREAVALAERTSPDVLLLDLEMPELDGIEVTRALTASGSPPRIVVLTTFADRDRILGALDAGALGYLLKDAEPDEIIRGVRAAARGESPLAPRRPRTNWSRERAPGPSRGRAQCPRARGARVGRRGPPEQADRPPARDQREDSQGPSDQGCSPQIGVTDRTQAALWAQRHKIAPQPPATARGGAGVIPGTPRVT